jgi:hypothetical protein
MCARRRKIEGKRAGEDPYPMAELRRQLAVAAEQQGGGCIGDRSTASMAVAATGYAEPRAQAAL